MRKKVFSIAIVILSIIAIPILVSQGQASAATKVKSVIADKALYQGVYKCYTNGYVKSNIESLSDYSGSLHPLEYLVDDPNNKSGENYVPLVTGWEDRSYKINDNGLSCKQLFNGYSGFGGSANNLLLAFKKNAPGISDSSGIIELTKNMGYEVTTSKGDSCYSLNYKKYGTRDGIEFSSTGTTNQVCQDGSGNLYAESVDTSSLEAPSTKFTVENQKVCLYLPSEFGSERKGCTELESSQFNGEGLMSAVNDICGSVKCENNYGTSRDGTKVNSTVEFDSSIESGAVSGDSLKNSSASFKDGFSSSAAMAANSFLSGGEIDEGIAAAILVRDLEKRMLYQAYLTSYYNVEVNCGSGLSDSAYDGKINWLDDDGKIKECHYETNEAKNKDKKVNGIDGGGYFEYESFDLDGLIDAFDDLSTEFTEEEAKTLLGASDGDDEKEATCLSSGAAENLGWIICPILSFASDQAQNLYDELIEPALQIKPGLIGNDDSSNNNAYQAWTTFQGFANTIFIIFFLVVIFSQVTGVGIDNYGIKKILPKLIIAAILVNLSYVICQVCVDLSNIVGNGIQALFNGLKVPVTAYINNNGERIDVGASIGSTMITAVGIAGAAYLAYITFALWILPLIVALIGVIIAIIFLFILLAGRQAIVVVLVIISPLAFVCYLLPNTKKLFDKYVKIGEVMLLLYPICSLMVAGGGYVSKLFLSLVGTNELDLFYTLAAMLISIVPIFFIPKVVKSSFNALGSMGATISGFGARLSGRAKGAIKGSGAYKAGQERLGEARTRWRAGIGADGKPVDMTLGQRLRRGSFTDRGIAKARAQYNKDQSARLAEGLLLDSDYMANAAIHRDVAASNEREKMYSEIFNRETDRNKVKAELGAALAGSDAERASASLNALIKKGGIDEALGELSGAGWSSMNSDVRDRVLQAMGDSGVDAMKAFSIYKKSGGSGSFSQWAKGTAADKNKATVKYGSYAGYLQQKGSGAMNGYGKDEMQFVKSLQNALASNTHGMGARDFGRMMGNAGIHSNDAQARAEANNIIRQQIGSGAMTAQDLGLSAEGVSAMSKGMSDAIVNGYNDYLANTYPGSAAAQTPGAAAAMARTAFSQQINDIRSDNTGRLLGKMDPNTRKNLGL